MSENDKPDEKAIEMLEGELSRGWMDILYSVPETQLDLELRNCTILKGKQSVFQSIPSEVLLIDEIYIDGDLWEGDLWSAVRHRKVDILLDVFGTMCGTKCQLLIFWDEEPQTFTCECVFKDKRLAPCPPECNEFRERIYDWCQAAVTLGLALHAETVERAGQFGPEPLVLWKRGE